MKRKVIQIASSFAVETATHNSTPFLYALCDDGAILQWTRHGSNIADGWIEIDAIPQPDDKTA